MYQAIRVSQEPFCCGNGELSHGGNARHLPLQVCEARPTNTSLNAYPTFETAELPVGVSVLVVMQSTYPFL